MLSAAEVCDSAGRQDVLHVVRKSVMKQMVDERLAAILTAAELPEAHGKHSM